MNGFLNRPFRLQDHTQVPLAVCEMTLGTAGVVYLSSHRLLWIQAQLGVGFARLSVTSCEQDEERCVQQKNPAAPGT